MMAGATSARWRGTRVLHTDVLFRSGSLTFDRRLNKGCWLSRVTHWCGSTVYYLHSVFHQKDVCLHPFFFSFFYQVGPPSSPVELCRKHGYTQKHSGSRCAQWQVSGLTTCFVRMHYISTCTFKSFKSFFINASCDMCEIWASTLVFLSTSPGKLSI